MGKPRPDEHVTIQVTPLHSQTTSDLATKGCPDGSGEGDGPGSPQDLHESKLVNGGLEPASLAEIGGPAWGLWVSTDRLHL